MIPRSWVARLRSTLLFNPCFIAQRGLSRHLAALLRQAVQPGQTWVDVGCGLRPYEGFFAGARYIGLDVPTSGRQADQKKPDLYYDGMTLPLDDGAVDGVLSTQVLEHVLEPARLMAEFSRVLKPGGALVLSLPFFYPLHEQPYDFYRFTEFAVRRLLDTAGFQVEALNKSSGTFEAVAQAASLSLSGGLIARLPCACGRGLLLVGLCAPAQLTGLLLQRVLPDPGDLYLDNIVLARRRGSESPAPVEMKTNSRDTYAKESTNAR